MEGRGCGVRVVSFSISLVWSNVFVFWVLFVCFWYVRRMSRGVLLFIFGSVVIIYCRRFISLSFGVVKYFESNFLYILGSVKVVWFCLVLFVVYFKRN